MIIRKDWLVWALVVSLLLYGISDLWILKVLNDKTDLIAEACAVNDARLRFLEDLAH